MRTSAAFLFISVQVWGAASQVSMLISSHGNCAEAWVSEFEWATSPLEQRERRQKTVQRSGII